MTTRLRKLSITNIDVVDVGANPHARICLFKRAAHGGIEPIETPLDRWAVDFSKRDPAGVGEGGYVRGSRAEAWRDCEEMHLREQLAKGESEHLARNYAAMSARLAYGDGDYSDEGNEMDTVEKALASSNAEIRKRAATAILAKYARPEVQAHDLEIELKKNLLEPSWIPAGDRQDYQNLVAVVKAGPPASDRFYSSTLMPSAISWGVERDVILKRAGKAPEGYDGEPMADTVSRYLATRSGQTVYRKYREMLRKEMGATNAI